MRHFLGAFDVLPGWVWALLCAGAISSAAVSGYRLNTERAAHAQTKTERATEARELAEAHGKELVRAMEREITLKTAAAQLQKDRQDENRRITARYERELDGLRNRPEARASAGGVPEGTAAGVGCTGAGLARPDAAFLAGYAADAARLQTAVNECKARHEALTN